MPNFGPIHLFKNMTKLVPSELEKGLDGIVTIEIKGEKKIPEKPSTSFRWISNVTANGLLIDLSMVEWLELSALCSLILLVEASLRDRINVTIVLPLQVRSSGDKGILEIGSSEDAEEQVDGPNERRKKVRRFLDYLRFREIIKCNHLGAPRGVCSVVERSNSDTQEKTEYEESLSSKEEDTDKGRYTNIFPLRWVSGENDYMPIRGFLYSVLENAGTGLTRSDAEAIVNTILFELVENVKDHSKISKHALLCAAVLPSSMKRFANEHLASIRDSINWLNNLNIPTLQLIIGDSGLGVPHELGSWYRLASKDGEIVSNELKTFEGNVMLWAFDRWSSSKGRDSSRGTRGLYRVSKIVQRYHGIVSMRSENQFVGLKYHNEQFKTIFNETEQSLFQCPGTLVQAIFPLDLPLKNIWPTVSGKKSNLQFKYFHINTLTEEGLTKEDRDKIINLYTKSLDKTSTCIIVCINDRRFLGRLDEERIKEAKSAIQQLLFHLAEIRQPGSMVLYLTMGGWDFIQGIVTSFNKEIERDKKNALTRTTNGHEVLSPVLVLGEKNRYAWAGADDFSLKLLDELVAKPDGISQYQFEKLFTRDEAQMEVARRLSEDHALFESNKSGLLRLRVNPTMILQFVQAELSMAFAAELARRDPSVICRTPSLNLVKKWFNIEASVESSIGSQLLGVSIAKLILENIDNKHLSTLTILADPMAVPSHYEACAQFLGIGGRKLRLGSETDVPNPLRRRLFDKNQSVVVFCDIISSSEAVKQCLRQILRDQAHPLLIVTLVDGRKDVDEPVEMYDDRVKVLSLVKLDLCGEPLDEQIHINNISPVTKRVETEDHLVLPDSIRINDGDLHKAITNARSLQITHIERPIGRHFTFYLDAQHLVESPIITSAIREEVEKWIKLLSIPPKEQIQVWHAYPEPKPSEPAKRMAEFIAGLDLRIKRKAFQRGTAYGNWIIGNIANEEDVTKYVILVDWGAITGRTVIQMIREFAEAGVDNILVCVCLSQVPRYEEKFLSALMKLNVRSIKKNMDSLPFKDKGRLNSTQTMGALQEKDVQVRFIARFPIGVYAPHECPICQQVARYVNSLTNWNYFDEYIGRQKQKLEPSKYEDGGWSGDLNLLPADISVDEILEAYKFRVKLTEALYSTCSRQEIFEFLKGIVTADEKGDPSFERGTKTILRLLSLEAHWLHKAPLRFQALRTNLAKIALFALTNPNLPQEDKVSAIKLLRASTKSIFIQELTHIFSEVHQNLDLCCELLLGIRTYLERPYHQRPILLDKLRLKLVEMKEICNKNHADRELRLELEAIIDKVLLRIEEIKAGGYDRRKAIESIQGAIKIYTDLAETHHLMKRASHLVPGPLKADIDELLEKSHGLFTLADLKPDYTNAAIKDYFVTLWENWHTIFNFLEQKFVAALWPLRKIISSHECYKELGTDAVRWLIEQNKHLGKVLESPISKLIYEVSRDPKRPLSIIEWQRISWDTTFLWETFFQIDRVDRDKDAPFIRFFRDFPLQLNDAINKFASEIELQSWKFKCDQNLIDKKLEVLCVKSLLDDFYEQVLQNIKERIVDPDKPVRIEIKQLDDDSLREMNLVKIFILNDNTKSKIPIKLSGLQNLDERFLPFDGNIAVESKLCPSWATFGVVLTLKIW